MIMGVRGADTIFHADLGRVKQQTDSNPCNAPACLWSWCQLPNGAMRAMKTSLYIAPTCSVFISWHRIQKEEGSNKLIGTINIQDLRVLNCSQCELLWMRYLWFFMMIMWHKKQIYISHYTRDHLAQDFYSRHKNISSAEKIPTHPCL